MYILNKATLTAENRSTVLHNLFLLDMYIFSKLAIENDHLKKATRFFIFMKWVQLPHGQIMVLEDKSFHHKVLSKLYRNSKFNVLVNFHFVLSKI